MINTQRMLCSNQEMLRTVLGFLADEPPVLCDWLPWNHTFGGNHNVGIALYNGGTLYIDEGKPAPGLFDATVRNLREIATTAYFNVPKGYEMLIPALKADAAFAKHFFSRLNIVFYAACGLKQNLWDDLQDLNAMLDGTWHEHQTWAGMAENDVLVAPLKNMSDDAKKMAEDTINEIKSGKLVVFSGPVSDQDGTLVVKKGEVMPDKEIDSINFYVKGITDKLPGK